MQDEMDRESIFLMGIKESNTSIMPGVSNIESGLPSLQPLQQVSRGDLSSSKC